MTWSHREAGQELAPLRTDRSGMSGRARQGLVAFLLYLGASFVLYGLPVLGRFGSVFVGLGTADARFYVWCLAWWPHAISSGLNPFLPTVVWAPVGTNLAWATGLPGPALVMWPVTSLFGPVVSSNVLSIVSPALTGWAAYLLCRRAVTSFPAALVGGYLFGFSTYEIAQHLAHTNLFLVFPVPLAAYLVVRHIDGSISSNRFVVLLTLVLIAEFSISTEIALTMALFGGVALVGLWWLEPALRSRLRSTLPLVAASYLVAGVLLAPYLYYAVTGPNPIRRPGIGAASIDAVSFFIPPRSVLIDPSILGARAIRTNVFENGAYLTPVIIVVLVHAAVTLGRRDRAVRWLLLFAGVAALASLGGVVHVGGRSTIPGPWIVFGWMPLIRMAAPERFTLYVWLSVAVVFAIWLAASPRSWLRWGAAGVAAVLLLPNAWSQDLHGAATAPRFFTSGLHARWVPPGQTVLVIGSGDGDVMLWQAEAGFSFPMAEGRTGGQPPGFRDPGVYRAISYGKPQSVRPALFRAFLRAHGVRVVIVDDHVADAWRPVLAGAALTCPTSVGGVQVYRITSSTTCRNGSSARGVRRTRRLRTVPGGESLQRLGELRIEHRGDPAGPLQDHTVAERPVERLERARTVGAQTGLGVPGGVFGQRHRAAQRGAGGDELLHEAHLICAAGADPDARDQQVQGVADAHDARQALRAAVDVRHAPPTRQGAELRRVAGDAHVAPRSQLQAAGEAEPLHRRDRRLRGIQRGEPHRSGSFRVRSGDQRTGVGQVGPAAERLPARAGHHEHALRIVHGEPLDALCDQLGRLAVDRVVDFGAVDRQHRDRVPPFDFDLGHLTQPLRQDPPRVGRAEAVPYDGPDRPDRA